MKIVQIVTQMEAGGAQRVAMLLSEGLLQRGYDSEVWFLYLKRPCYMSSPHVKVLLDHTPSKFEYLKILRNLHRQLCIDKPDVLITHTHYANILGQFAAGFCNISQRIAVQHNPFSTYPRIANWLDLILGITPFYSHNIAVSQTVLDSASEYPIQYQQKLQRIYNGIPLPGKIKIDRNIRVKWGIPCDNPLLLNVGRLAKQKNQIVLINAMQQIPEAHLVILGDGELRSYLQEQIEQKGLTERVHLLGELPSNEVLDFLSSADVFVFPSLFESMGLAVVEAMSIGLPVVASDIPGLQETLGNAGCFVQSDNPTELANSVRRILNSSLLSEQMRSSSLERSKVFSLESMINSYESLFASNPIQINA